MQDEEKTVDIDTSGPDVDVQLPQEEPKEETMKQTLKTVVSPLIHLRNLLSSLMLNLKKRKHQRTYKELLKMKVINDKTTVRKLKNILRASKKE